MKLYSIIALVAATSAIKIVETPQEVGVPNTPGPLFALKHYNTPPLPTPGDKSKH